jgi:hypothetical protein
MKCTRSLIVYLKTTKKNKRKKKLIRKDVLDL